MMVIIGTQGSIQVVFRFLAYYSIDFHCGPIGNLVDYNDIIFLVFQLLLRFDELIVQVVVIQPNRPNINKSIQARPNFWGVASRLGCQLAMSYPSFLCLGQRFLVSVYRPMLCEEEVERIESLKTPSLGQTYIVGTSHASYLDVE